jgi:hypothetical protein
MLLYAASPTRAWCSYEGGGGSPVGALQVELVLADLSAPPPTLPSPTAAFWLASRALRLLGGSTTCAHHKHQE